MRQEQSPLTKKEGLITKSSAGFSIAETIIAGALFTLIGSGLAAAWLYGQESILLSGERTQAVFLAEEGLEAVRDIRDDIFTNLSDGTYGLMISNNEWILSGSQDITDIFTREITIETVDSDRKKITSTVTWSQGGQRTGVVTLVTRLTNWQESTTPTTCSAFCSSVGYTIGVCRQNATLCASKGEIYESDGDQYCTNTPAMDTCCCKP